MNKSLLIFDSPQTTLRAHVFINRHNGAMVVYVVHSVAPPDKLYIFRELLTYCFPYTGMQATTCWFSPTKSKVKATEGGTDGVDAAVKGTKEDTGGSTEPEPNPLSLTDLCFVALLWAIALVQVWKNLWLIQLIPVLLSYLLLKKLGETFFVNINVFSMGVVKRGDS